MYELSFGAFFFGLLMLAVGVVFMRWHQWVADNFGGGVGSYDRYKLWAIISCGVGFVVMLNLHTLILGFLFNRLFS